MNAETARILLLKLPHAEETLQWGENLVFWVGSKALGGKMFALVPLDVGRFVISFAAGPERASELGEQDGVAPAPYLARAHWVAAERWDVWRRSEWEQHFQAAHAYVWGRMPRKSQRAVAGRSGGEQSALPG